MIRLYSTFGSKEMLEAWEKVRTREYTDLDGYLKKYGMSELIQVGLFFEGIGILQYRKLIDIGLVDDLFSTPIKWTWEKMKPLAEDYRKQSERPKYLSGLNTPTMKCRKENKHYDKHNNKHPFLFFYCFFHKS